MIFASDQPWTLSANGTMFRYDRPGIVPSLLARWYAERKDLQKIKGQWTKLKDGIKIPNRLSTG
jgi:hypothetical protein